jgi:hypothetical protein
MRRLLALAALAAATLAAAPAHASYKCLPDENATNAVCVQFSDCADECYVAPGVQFKCSLGFSGETACRVVRHLGFGAGGR